MASPRMLCCFSYHIRYLALAVCSFFSYSVLTADEILVTGREVLTEIKDLRLVVHTSYACYYELLRVGCCFYELICNPSRRHQRYHSNRWCSADAGRRSQLSNILHPLRNSQQISQLQPLEFSAFMEFFLILLKHKFPEGLLGRFCFRFALGSTATHVLWSGP